MKIAVLGGGPGGYVAAIRAAQLGAEVTLIEQKALGGTCLNVGCIPTKVLLHTSELAGILKREAGEMGIDVPGFTVNWPQVQKHKDKIIRQNAGGIDALLKANGIAKIIGQGAFADRHRLEVTLPDGTKREVPFNSAIIATGSKPGLAPIPGIGEPGVLTSDEALSLDRIPASLCIIGGGVIGCEFASVYANLDNRVTIVEQQPELIGNMDQDTVQCLVKELQQTGVAIHTGTRVEKIERTGSGLSVSIEGPDGSGRIEAENVLLSIGRRPVTEGLGLERIGVQTERGRIVADKRQRTSIPHIYAIGDCTGGVMLAHAASAQGVLAAETILQQPSPIDFRTIPYCVYTRPELAGVGLTEKLARERGLAVKTGVFPLQANGKSKILGEAGGMVKVVADTATGEILGLHMAGPRATELIAEGALAIRLEATLEELITTIHAHPTVAESLHEAFHAVHGTAIHIPPPRKPAGAAGRA